MNTFGEFLYSLRKEKGITQAELAEKLGVTNKAVSKWETGEAMPETSLLLPISQIFNVTVDELLNGKRNEKQDEDRGEKEDAFNEQFIKNHLFTRGKDDESTLTEKICGAVCAFIIFAATVTYLCLGIFANLWSRYWVIVPVASLSCGIVGIIFDLCNRRKRERKIAKGENPYTGAICGLIMLTGIIVYILLGAILNLWHPYWIILAASALFCGFIGGIGDLIFHIKKK